MIDDILMAGAKSKGKRPCFFEDPAVERVLGIAMALAQELAVTRERLDTLERILESKGVMSRDEIESFRPDPEAETQRQRAHAEYIARVLRIVQQEREAVQQGEPPRDMDDIARREGP